VSSLKRWLWCLAAGGSAVGAVTALASAPSGSRPATATLSASTSSSAAGGEDSLAQLTAEAQNLQKTINALEAQINGYSPGASPSQLAAEKQQLDSESSEIAQERNSLAAYQANLETEAKQLASEEQQFRAAQQAAANQPQSPTSGGDGGSRDS